MYLYGNIQSVPQHTPVLIPDARVIGVAFHGIHTVIPFKMYGFPIVEKILLHRPPHFLCHSLRGTAVDMLFVPVLLKLDVSVHLILRQSVIHTDAGQLFVEAVLLSFGQTGFHAFHKQFLVHFVFLQTGKLLSAVFHKDIVHPHTTEKPVIQSFIIHGICIQF